MFYFGLFAISYFIFKITYKNVLIFLIISCYENIDAYGPFLYNQLFTFIFKKLKQLGFILRVHINLDGT